MKINLFNGGLSTLVAPHLANPNEAVEYTNIDNVAGVLKPVKKKSILADAVNDYFWRFNSTWISSTAAREYVDYKGKTYWTEDSATAKVYDGTNTYQLGITKPSTAATIAAAASSGNLTGTITYCFTFYDNSTGVESQPNTVTNEITVSAKSIDISGIPTSSDPQVDKVRIYRIGGTLTSYTLVTTLNEGTTTYNDNIADTDVDGHILDSQNYGVAPSGLRYLTEHNGIFFGAVSDKLYFTPIAKPYAWSSLDFIDYEADITGIGSTPTGLAVFMQDKTHIVTGSTPADLTNQLFSGNQGCVNHSTISTIKGQLVWLSEDGICATRGGLVDVISRPKLGKLSITSVNAVVHDDVYYLLTSDKIISLDLRFNPLYKELDKNGYTRLGVFNDVLYGVTGGFIATLFTATRSESLTWKSVEFTEGDYTMLKAYKSVYVHSDGQSTFEIFINDKSVLYTNISGKGIKEIKIPAEKQRGYKIQFKVTGTGTVNEIEYKVVGRQNGK